MWQRGGECWVLIWTISVPHYYIHRHTRSNSRFTSPLLFSLSAVTRLCLVSHWLLGSGYSSHELRQLLLVNGLPTVTLWYTHYDWLRLHNYFCQHTVLNVSPAENELDRNGLHSPKIYIQQHPHALSLTVHTQWHWIIHSAQLTTYFGISNSPFS